MVAFGPFWKVAGTYESSLEISLQDVKLLTTYRIDLVNSGRFYRFEKLKIQSSFSCSLYCMETKRSSDKMLPPVGIEAGPLVVSDSKSNTILSGLT